VTCVEASWIFFAKGHLSRKINFCWSLEIFALDQPVLKLGSLPMCLYLPPSCVDHTTISQMRNYITEFEYLPRNSLSDETYL
jgi:hypothetical protein